MFRILFGIVPVRVAVILVSATVVLFCNTAVADSPTVLKLAHQWAAVQSDGRSDTRSLMAVKFAKHVEELSDGALQIEIYPGNSLIQPKQEWNALRTGALDMAIIVPGYFTGRVPELAGLGTIGMFASTDAAYRFLRGSGGDVVRGLFEDHGMRLVATVVQPLAMGFRDQKVTNPNELDGLVMRAPTATTQKLFAEYGASIATMPSSDLYFALQTGGVDGFVTTFASMRSYALYENMGYLALSPSGGGINNGAVPMLMSKKTWDSLTDNQKNIIKKASNMIMEWVPKRSKNIARINVEFFEENGVNAYELSNDQFSAWMGAAKPILKDFADTSDAAAKMVKYAQQANKKAAND